jgi:hypothetical protein
MKLPTTIRNLLREQLESGDPEVAEWLAHQQGLHEHQRGRSFLLRLFYDRTATPNLILEFPRHVDPDTNEGVLWILNAGKTWSRPSLGIVQKTEVLRIPCSCGCLFRGGDDR